MKKVFWTMQDIQAAGMNPSVTEVLAQNAAWRRRASINLFKARKKAGRNLTTAEIHEVTRKTR